jgi:hypothetical protein
VLRRGWEGLQTGPDFKLPFGSFGTALFLNLYAALLRVVVLEVLAALSACAFAL